MRVFVYEHITGGVLSGEDLPEGLHRDADRMVRSLVLDLDLAGYEVVTTRDARLPAITTGAKVIPVAHRHEWGSAWTHALEWADAVWPIAPETGGVLRKLSEAVLQRQRILLGSRPQAVEIASSKHATCRRLREAGVNTLDTWSISDLPVDVPPPWVLKPDDGAGCEGTHIISTRHELCAWANTHGNGVGSVIQRFVGGDPASLSLICSEESVELLACNRQIVERVGSTLHFRGTRVGALNDRWPTWELLAQSVASAITGLWGYVGVDLLVTGGETYVLEINPRLTVSYSDLRAAWGCNPAALVMDLAKRETMQFDSDQRNAPCLI